MRDFLNGDSTPDRGVGLWQNTLNIQFYVQYEITAGAFAYQSSLPRLLDLNHSVSSKFSLFITSNSDGTTSPPAACAVYLRSQQNVQNKSIQAILELPISWIYYSYSCIFLPDGIKMGSANASLSYSAGLDNMDVTLFSFNYVLL